MLLKVLLNSKYIRNWIFCHVYLYMCNLMSEQYKDVFPYLEQSCHLIP